MSPHASLKGILNSTIDSDAKMTTKTFNNNMSMRFLRSLAKVDYATEKIRDESDQIKPAKK